MTHDQRNAEVDPSQLTRVRGLTRSGVARAIRVGAGLSLDEVAQAIHAHPSTILRWERGERIPRGQKAIAYLEQLDSISKATA